MMSKKLIILTILSVLLIWSCEPLFTVFEDVEDPVEYTAASIIDPPPADSTIKVITWNIRFGAERMNWFGDACGDRVILNESEINQGLTDIAEQIIAMDPDVLLIQEIDVLSKRTGYEDQVQRLLDDTKLNYGLYASAWKSQFIASDGIGRMDMGNAILSKYPLEDGIRYQLSLRGDQDALTQAFYLRRCILEARLDHPNIENLYVVNAHLTAFATDDTKQKHLDSFKKTLDDIAGDGDYFIAGGDLNQVPPFADSLDFCLEDICEDESYHQPGDDPFHKEGSYFDPEISNQALYDTYFPAVRSEDYQANESRYFTHTPEFEVLDGWNRKIDYLWSNITWIPDSDSTRIEANAVSDHLPVEAHWRIP